MDLIDREKALGCFWNYANDDGTGYDETDMPAYDRLQALPIVAEVEDCISRQALCEYALNQKDKSVTPNDIMRFPSAQPEIIRCKDCKNSEHWYRDRSRCFLWHEDGIGVFEDGFCNYAERRQDEQTD